jgi:hypothetical protein
MSGRASIKSGAEMILAEPWGGRQERPREVRIEVEGGEI